MSVTKRRKRKAKFQALETIRHRESSKRCPNPLGNGQKMLAVMQKKMMLEKMKMCRRCYRTWCWRRWKCENTTKWKRGNVSLTFIYPNLRSSGMPITRTPRRLPTKWNKPACNHKEQTRRQPSWAFVTSSDSRAPNSNNLLADAPSNGFSVSGWKAKPLNNGRMQRPSRDKFAGQLLCLMVMMKTITCVIARTGVSHGMFLWSSESRPKYWISTSPGLWMFPAHSQSPSL